MDAGGVIAEKLNRMSEEQQALLPVVRDEWIKAGLSTEPADRQKAKDGVRLAYEAAGLPPPSLFVWLRSPLEGAVGAELLSHLDSVAGLVERQVREPSREQVRRFVSFKGQVSERVGLEVWDQIYDPVYRHVLTPVRDEVDHRVRQQVDHRVRGQVMEQITRQVGDHPACNRVRRLWPAGAQHGQHDAVDLGFFDLYRRLGLRRVDRLEGLMTVARAAGWWWPFRGLVLLTERPRHLVRDGEGRLHSETGPALSYPDGFGVWAWHGVRVERDVIERPQSLEPRRISEEANVEVRRVMMERYGLGRYLRAVEATKVDEVHEPPFPGLLDARLWRMEVARDEPLCMVELVNSTLEPDGSARSYVLRVPPDVQTAHQAVAWTFGMAEHEYAPVVES